MSEYWKPKYLGEKVKVELDLLTKADLKDAIHQNFLKGDLAVKFIK